ncbi:MAG: DUF6525 family protein [Paracoccaceae bacterium]
MSTHRPSASNLGQCNLRRKRRNGHPMDTYDGLPQPIRQWVAQAALHWSPTSVRRIWSKSHAKSLSDDEALHTLTQAGARTLARDHQSTAFKLNALT